MRRPVGGLLLVVLLGLSCARPPRFPADHDHLDASNPRACYDCHHRDTSPPMHPSHFTATGSLKPERRTCRNCHKAVGARTRYAP